MIWWAVEHNNVITKRRRTTLVTPKTMPCVQIRKLQIYRFTGTSGYTGDLLFANSHLTEFSRKFKQPEKSYFTSGEHYTLDRERERNKSKGGVKKNSIQSKQTLTMCLGLPFASSAKRNRWVYKSLISREMGGDDDKQNKDNTWTSPPNRPYQEKDEDMKIWGILLFGLVGATATTLAVSYIQFHLFSCY